MGGALVEAVVFSSSRVSMPPSSSSTPSAWLNPRTNQKQKNQMMALFLMMVKKLNKGVQASLNF
jgi:hypothetical protein